MATEGAARVGDTPPVAQLIDCTPEPEVLSVDVSAVPDASPVQQAMDATIAQTGCDPPPVEP
jgi:hypothetical protein